MLDVVRSGAATAAAARHGHRCVILCEGSRPVVRFGGELALPARLSVRGTTARVELGAVEGGRLRIGEGSFINQGSSIVAHDEITIGDHARIGDFVAIYDTDHHPVQEGAAVRRAPVRIGSNVWLGRGAVILPGTDVGDHVVVGAGSVVSGHVPARTLVVGSPARAVRTLVANDAWMRP